MRLIDADKLPYVNKVILVDDVDGDITITVAKEHTSYVNDETPTVKALPIEWIKSKKIEYEHDRYDYVRGCFDGFNDCIDYLIDEWEKENEAN